MEVLSDLEAALHLTDDTAASTTTSASSTTHASSVTSNNNSSSSVSSSSNLNSNTIVTQAIISSPSRSGVTALPFDGLPHPNSQIDESVIVKQPVSVGDGASSLLNNNNDVSAKDRVHVTAVVVGTHPI
jgi:hypothetical protein